MLSNIGFPGLILIIIFALIVFGPKRLPELGKSMGKTLREFKSATKGIMGDDDVVPAGTTVAPAAITAVAASAAPSGVQETQSVMAVSTLAETATDKA